MIPLLDFLTSVERPLGSFASRAIRRRHTASGNVFSYFFSSLADANDRSHVSLSQWSSSRMGRYMRSYCQYVSGGGCRLLLSLGEYPIYTSSDSPGALKKKKKKRRGGFARPTHLSRLIGLTAEWFQSADYFQPVAFN